MNPNVDLAWIARIGVDPAPQEGSARETTAFAAMAAEIAKLDSIHATEVSWTSVRDLALQVLAHTHDFLAVAYLAHALQRTHGFPGLAAGLAGLRNLVKDRWSEAQPPPDRLRARRSAVQWLADRAAKHAVSTARDPIAEAACEQAARALAEMCRERFEGSDAGFAQLARLFAPPAGSIEPAESGVASSSSDAVVVESIRPFGSATLASRSQAIQKLSEAALYFQRCEPHSPIGPLLQRALGWSGKSFSEVFTELLGSAPEAKAGMWRSLGIAAEGERP